MTNMTLKLLQNMTFPPDRVRTVYSIRHMLIAIFIANISLAICTLICCTGMFYMLRLKKILQVQNEAAAQRQDTAMLIPELDNKRPLETISILFKRSYADKLSKINNDTDKSLKSLNEKPNSFGNNNNNNNHNIINNIHNNINNNNNNNNNNNINNNNSNNANSGANNNNNNVNANSISNKSTKNDKESSKKVSQSERSFK